MFGCCESESTLNCACLIILSHIVVYNCNTYAHVSSVSVRNVGMSFVMLKRKQQLCLEVAIWNFFNKNYGKYQYLSSNSVNATKNDSANSGNAA